MTKDEKFALTMLSLVNDAINSHTGLLKSLAGKIPPGMTYQTVDREMREVKRPVTGFLNGQAHLLQKKLKRMKLEIAEHVGGQEQLRALVKEDWGL